MIDTARMAALKVTTLLGSAFRLSRGYSADHDAADFTAPEGTPIVALADGIVEYAGNDSNRTDAEKHNAIGGGNTVNIRDAGGVFQYAHMRNIAPTVRDGARVVKGQVIGYVGSTGKSTGPHLHLGRQVGGKWIDPVAYIENMASSLPNQTDMRSVTLDLKGLKTAFRGGGFTDSTVLTKTHIDQMVLYFMETYGVGTPGIKDAARAALTAVLSPFEGKTFGSLPDSLSVSIPNQTPNTDPLTPILGEAGQGGGAMGVAEFLGKLAEELFDPANWLRVIALLAGMGIFAYGTITVVGAMKQPVAVDA